jgi:hypothetical protein
LPNNLNLVLTSIKKNSWIIHRCYYKHSSHHRCTSFCWSSGGIFLSSWVGIFGQEFRKNSASHQLFLAEGWNPQDVL